MEKVETSLFCSSDFDLNKICLCWPINSDVNFTFYEIAGLVEGKLGLNLNLPNRKLAARILKEEHWCTNINIHLNIGNRNIHLNIGTHYIHINVGSRYIHTDLHLLKFFV